MDAQYAVIVNAQSDDEAVTPGATHPSSSPASLAGEIEAVQARLASARGRVRLECLNHLEQLLARRYHAAKRPDDRDWLVTVTRMLTNETRGQTRSYARNAINLIKWLKTRDGRNGLDHLEAQEMLAKAAQVNGSHTWSINVDFAEARLHRYKQTGDQTELEGVLVYLNTILADFMSSTGLRSPNATRADAVGADDWRSVTFPDTTPQEIGRCFVGMASALRFRYRLLSKVDDLEDAERAGSVALLVSRPGGERAFAAASLAITLQQLAESTSDHEERLTVLTRAIAFAQQSIGSSGATQDRRLRSRYATLAGLLGLKATLLRNADIVRNAIDLHKKSLISQDKHASNRAWQLTNFATCIELLHDLNQEQTGEPDLALQIDAMRASEDAWHCRQGQETVGLLDTAVVFAGQIRRFRPNHGGLLPALTRACKVLDTMLERENLGSRELENQLARKFHDLSDWLVETQAHASMQAAVSGDRSDAHRHAVKTFHAIERAKQRSLVAEMDVQALVLDDEASLQDLERLQSISRRLTGMEHGGTRDGLLSLFQAVQQTAPTESRAVSRAALVSERKKLLQAIRTRNPGFANGRGFVKPRSVETVVNGMPLGTTIVILYPLATETIVLGVSHGTEQQLPQVTVASASLSREEIDQRVQFIFTGTNGAALQKPEHSNLDDALKQLGKALRPALAEVVPGWKEVTEASGETGPVGGTTSRRLILIPTGQLHRLPLHAISLHVPDQGDLRLIDRFVVSYASTADILSRVAEREAPSTATITMAPASPATARERPLDLTVAYAQALAVRAHGRAIIRHAATRVPIEAGELRNHRLVCLASHGRAASRAKDNEAGLLLHSGIESQVVGQWLPTSDILATVSLEGVEHLQLLACQTHAGDPEPGDHLSSLLTTMLTKGARSIGGTMWAVNQIPAICIGWWIANALLHGDRDKASAFQHAVQRLRKASRLDITNTLAEIHGELESLPNADMTALEKIDRLVANNIDTMEREDKDNSVDYFGLHHWAPYVLHGAPLMWNAPGT